MPRLIAELAWERTPLGPRRAWPDALRHAVSLMLEAKAPIAVYWGPELVLLYNDAWRPLIGEKHPEALGQPARLVFGEIWQQIKPLFDRVLSGQGAEEIRDELLPLSRKGRRENAWFTFTINPIRDDSGIAGIFNIAVETTDRVHVEHALSESEEFYRLATAAGGIGTWDLDVDTGESRLSPIMTELLGTEPGQPISHEDWERAIQLDDRKRIQAAIEATAATGRPFEVEFRVTAKDGRYRWLLSRDGGVHVSPDGRRRIFGATVDVTTRKMAEEAARSSEARLAMIFARATVGLSEIGPGARFVRVNNELCRLLGRTQEELLGLAITDVTYGPDRETSLDVAMQVLQSGVPATLDKRYIRPDGTVVWAQSSLARIAEEEEERPRILAVTVDLTARLAAEATRRESEERYRALVTNLPGGAAFTLDKNMRFLAAEGEALRQAGWTAAELLGRTLSEALDPPVAAAFVPRIRRALEGEPFELEHRLYDRQYLSRGVPLKDENGKVFAVLVCAFDITQRIEAERALRDADRRKDEFLATLAHELRNPLAPLRNGIHLLRRTLQVTPPVTRNLDMMDRQLSHLTRLVDDLLDLGRISAGKIELQRRVLSMGQVLGTTAERSRAMMEMHGHQLVLELPANDVLVTGDADRLTQVFSNLLANAAKYTERGGRITVSLVSTEQDAVVRVTDTGIGIPPGAIRHVFDLFSQVQAHQCRSDGGLGIGLSLVRSLVVLHGGSVNVTSEGTGRGSTFTVRIPLALRETLSQEIREPTGPRQASAGQKILVADDNIDAAISLAALLEIEGHEVTVAHDGVDAIRKAREFQPAIAILNLNMPLMTGIDAARRIRRLPGLRGIRLIALTGRGLETDRQETRAAGFERHLVKPVDHAALTAILDSATPAAASSN
jgi:PAS domain S-box-containing protein